MRISLFTAMTSLAAISCAGVGEKASPGDAGADGGAVIACSKDQQCGSNGGCVSNRCVDRVDNLAGWAVELTPRLVTNLPAGASVPAVTELLSVSGSPVVLTASAAVSLVVPFKTESTSTAALPATGSVILTVPSRIPGRPDQAFQASFGAPATSATLSVPETVLGQQATVNLIPVSPSDLTTPPYTFLDVQVPPPGQMLDALPVPASFKISGQLLDALDNAKGNFTARAFQSGTSRIASTTATTSMADGGFTIFLPAGAGAVNLELANSASTDPWMTLGQIQAPMDLGPIALPASAAANAFRVTVHGNDSLQTPVANAAVRAFTTFMGGDQSRTAKYLRDGTSDASGMTQLTLIPGDSQTARSYAISVVPPAGSPWASQCVTGVPVLWNGSATATIQDFMLVPRPVVRGTLLSVDGAPVANAVVTATRGPSAASDCLPGPATTSVITDATGAFALAVDPGDCYQLDYDPPAGSAAPRLTEYGVSVPAAVPKIVRLPRPALFEGDVHDAQSQTLGFTTIRIFEPRAAATDQCSPAPLAPTLRGQTQSDKDGHFRAIVVAPSPAN